MSGTKSNTFPSSKNEVLALLYVQSQDLSAKTPSEILDMYNEAYKELCHHYIDGSNS